MYAISLPPLESGKNLAQVKGPTSPLPSPLSWKQSKQTHHDKGLLLLTTLDLIQPAGRGSIPKKILSFSYEKMVNLHEHLEFKRKRKSPRGPIHPLPNCCLVWKKKMGLVIIVIAVFFLKNKIFNLPSCL